MLENLEHRGAVGADKTVGDGAWYINELYQINYLEMNLKKSLNFT